MTTERSLNYLQSNRATLTIHKLNDLNLTVQDFNLPGITVTPAIHPSPNRDIPIRGDKAVFEPLEVTFMVNEDLSNWIEVYRWLRNYSSPADNQAEFHSNPDLTYSDASLTIYSSHNNPLLTITFKEAFPVSLSSIEFTEQDAETIYKTASTTIEYMRYDIRGIDQAVG